MKQVDSKGLRTVLLLAGAFITFTGVNIAFGGITTLGLQGSNDFLQVTDPAAYALQDSHVRFLGGLWLGIGLLFLAATRHLLQLAEALKLALALIFLGGLARLTMMQPDVTFGPDIGPSLAAELIVMPILFLWVSRVSRKDAADK